jgi:hypothetical protein
MKCSVLKAALSKTKTGIASCVLLLASGVAMAQSTVSLTAAPTTITLPDGQVVPMWGYSCGAVTGTGASCTAMNGTAQTGLTWQPPLITVPAGALTITLTNNLAFAGKSLPTSLVIVGQLGWHIRACAAGHDLAWNGRGRRHLR